MATITPHSKPRSTSNITVARKDRIQINWRERKQYIKIKPKHDLNFQRQEGIKRENILFYG